MRLLRAVLVTVAMSCAVTALAGDPVVEAKAVEAEARKAFQAKQFEDSARAFARAHAIDPRAPTKYNEGFAWAKAGKPAAAADAYEAALELGLDGELAKKANASMAKLKVELGYLVVPGPAGGRVSVAHAVDRAIPAKIHLPVGGHQVSLKNAAGKDASLAVNSAAGVSHILEVPRALTEEAAPEPAPVAPALPKTAEPPQEDGSVMTALGWTAVGLGAAATGATIATGVLTLQKVDAYDEGGNVDAGLRDQATTFRTTTNVMIGVSSALVATGVLLLVLAPSGPDDDSSIAARLHIGPAGGAISLRW
jgi:tetratricopeptide (TPR) repeat protein